MLKPEITVSARKHGVSDADILHAFRNPIKVMTDGGVYIVIGGSISAQILELAVVLDASNVQIIHAMPARRKFLR